jgi:hypothetical protein
VKREEKAERTWVESVEREAAYSLFPDFVREQAEAEMKRKR